MGRSRTAGERSRVAAAPPARGEGARLAALFTGRPDAVAEPDAAPPCWSMTTNLKRRWVTIAMAGVAVTAGGCASMRGQRDASASGNPTAQRAEASQEQSQQALDRAADAQKKAAEQSRKATLAQQQVQKVQQELVEAQEKARVEQQKAQQLQTQASAATQDASRTTQRTQAQASSALSQQGQQMARHQQSTAGQVTGASAGSVTVRGHDGVSMTFLVDENTRVMVDGRPASSAELQPGEDAQIAYQVSGSQPTAMVIQVASGNPQTGSTPSRDDSTGTGAGPASPGDDASGDAAGQ